MAYLLDTNAFIKWIRGDVPSQVKRKISRTSAEVYLSILTPWEISIKPLFKKTGFTTDKVEEAMREIGATLLPIKLEHVAVNSSLPYFENHKDPFDRMLIAQALSEGLIMISSDQRFELYPDLRLLWK